MTFRFVGRLAELERLTQCWEQARHGQFSLVLIAGDGGSGKTTLAREFTMRLSDQFTVRSSGDEAESVLPFAVHDQLVEQLISLRRSAEDTASDYACVSERPVRDTFAEGEFLLECLSATSLIAPVALVIDDANLLDGPSLGSLTYALRRSPQRQLLVLMTARSETVGALPRGLCALVASQGNRIDLGGLSRHDVQAMASDLGLGRLSERAAERLREHSGGNPLHLRALMRDLTMLQAERLDVPLPAPRSLSLQVLGTLGETSQEAQRLASAASVLGGQPRLRDAARLGKVDDTLSAMEDLQRAHLADVVESDCDARVAFVHPLVRAAIYDDLKAARRAELHAGAAELTLGVASLSHRVRAAGDSPSPELVSAMTALAHRHVQVGAYTAAAEALLDAYRLSEPGASRDRLLLEAVDVLVFDGDLARATCYAGLVEQLPEDAYRLQVQAKMSWLAGRHGQAEALARRAWEFSDGLGDRTRDDVATMVAQMCIMRGDGDDAADWAGRALGSGSLAPHMAESTLGCAAIAAALVGRLDEGLASLPAEGLASGRTGYQPLRGARGMLRLWSDDLIGAAQDLRVAIPVTTAAAGGGPYRLVFHLYLAEAEYRCGNWEAAAALAEQGLAWVEDSGQDWLSTFGHAVASLVPSGRGNWDVASAHVAAAQRSAQVMGDQPSLAYAHNAALHLAACHGDAAAVVTAAGWLVANPGTHHEPGFFGWPAQHVGALVQLGLIDEAETRLSEIESLARARERRSVLAQVARLRAEVAVARRETSVARSLFEKAELLGAGVSDALECAVRQASYGRFLRRRGERRAASERLLDARNRFHAMGAGPFLQRVEEELACCGVKAVSNPAPVLPGLTAQEWTVAQLVCAGRTNRQVADELVVSVKTISYHLGNVYSKVGVRSRTELAALVLGSPKPG